MACAWPPATARADAVDARQEHVVATIALQAAGTEDVPGISIAVVRAGRLVLCAGYGLRDRARMPCPRAPIRATRSEP